jgi:hypothetical protein
MSDSEYKAQPFCSKKPERFMRRNYLRDLGYPPSGWGRYFNPAGLHTDCKSARAGIKIRLADGRMGCGWISEGLTQSETLTEAVASMNATRYSDSNVIPSFCFFEGQRDIPCGKGTGLFLTDRFLRYYFKILNY